MMKGSMSTDLGIITINPEVIAKYAGSMAIECFGIVGMAAVNMKDGLVHLLKRESASIIFGAMYDDTKSDECTITVIATGLHNVGGSASKLKARLEGQQKTSSILPNGAESHVRPSYDYTAQRTAQTSAARPQGGTMPTLQPRSTTGGVREQSINIPDFFKK